MIEPLSFLAIYFRNLLGVQNFLSGGGGSMPLAPAWVSYLYGTDGPSTN
jgi:hypothetical protein